MDQKFKLYTETGSIDLDNNISSLPEEHIKLLMNGYVEKYNLDKTKRYAVVGELGDIIVYNDGTIYQMCDSG